MVSGSHRIEGIGDKHVPWIHNVKNTDVVVAIDDNAVVNPARLSNEPAGQKYLASKGIPWRRLIANLGFDGFFGHFQRSLRHQDGKVLRDGRAGCNPHRIDSTPMQLYQSRLKEMHQESGEYTQSQAAADYARWLLGQGTDNLLELTYAERRRVHNLKYFTWVEQQGRTYEEIQAQWHDRDYWSGFQSQAAEIDSWIEAFNAEVGL